MEKAKKIRSGGNYSAADIGKLDELYDYSLVHPKTGQASKGKVFLKDLTGATGTEISLQLLAPGEAIPFFHIHRKNEETYIILKGSGDFQVDGDVFAIQEGSVVRIAPKGIRRLRNTGDGEMLYMVIQSKENSLEEYSTGDGERVEHGCKW